MMFMRANSNITNNIYNVLRKGNIFHKAEFAVFLLFCSVVLSVDTDKTLQSCTSEQKFCTNSLYTGNMKAVRVSQFGNADVLKVEADTPVPQPAENQVLIRVHAAGVNPVDTYIRTGTHTIKPTLPYIPGSDGAGVIEHSTVDKFNKGDRVYFRRCLGGSYAQYTTASAWEVFPLNGKLSFSQGAAIGVPYFTAYRALIHRCLVKPGETVLVHGASGAVGLAACQIARALGLKVFGTAGTTQGMQLVLKNGAHQVFNHNEPDYTKKIMEQTQGKGLDNVLEMLANVNLDKDLQMMNVHGRIAVIGNRGTIEINPRFTMTKEVSVHGVMMGIASEEETAETGAFLTAAQEQGWMQPHVGQEFAMSDAPKAHEEVIAHTGGTSGKIVLKID